MPHKYVDALTLVNEKLFLLKDDKLKTEREVPPHILGPEFACKHFPRKQDQYFHLHGGIEFDVGTPPLDDINEEMKVRN